VGAFGSSTFLSKGAKETFAYIHFTTNPVPGALPQAIDEHGE
jgi:hypothetical protein